MWHERLHKARAEEKPTVLKTNIALELIMHKVKLILAERVKVISFAPRGGVKNICEEKPSSDFPELFFVLFVCVLCER